MPVEVGARVGVGGSGVLVGKRVLVGKCVDVGGTGVFVGRGVWVGKGVDVGETAVGAGAHPVAKTSSNANSGGQQGRSPASA